MEENNLNNPPGIALKFFQWFCRPDLREELEGDLFELHDKCMRQYGLKKADIAFCLEVLFLFRPSIIGNIHHLTFNLFSDMKRLHWIQLIALNLLVTLCIILPFIPGSYDELSIGLSAMAQLTGFIGLIFVPIGILWLIQEIKKVYNQNSVQNNWNSGYYYAITAAIAFIFIALLLSFSVLVAAGIASAGIALAIAGFIFYKLLPQIKKLRKSETKLFNAAPLYLLSIPLMAFTIRFFFIGMLCDYSRNYAMEKGQTVVSAVENYYLQKGHYPESITELQHIPEPSIMGIGNFTYEKNGEAYNLSFSQSQFIFEVFATQELVMYNKNDEHNVKGHYAYYNAKLPHWKYYWLD